MHVHDELYSLFFRFDVGPPHEKKARVENGTQNGAAENGSAGDANGDTETPMDAEPEINLIKPLENFMKFVVWERVDAGYFLKNVRKHKIMSDEDENKAMAQILQSFVDSQQPVCSC